VDVCTTIFKGNVAAARVLGASLREFHPELRFHVLVVDEFEGHFDAAAQPFEVLRPEQLGISDFGRMAGVYEAHELCAAAKPWLLRHLLERDGCEGVIYLDPSIRLYGRIDDVVQALGEHGLVVTPRYLDPVPHDGTGPAGDRGILESGAYDRGFLGLAPGEFADRVLAWWSGRVEREYLIASQDGLAADQRSIDLVPGFAEDYVLIRDAGFDVAYWNLAGRSLTRDDGTYRVDDAPLSVFNFSGFDPLEPHVLSRHQDRIRLGDDPVLAELCRDYADALLAAGHEQTSQWPYTYATTASGIPLDERLRRLLRRALEAGVDASPFDPDGERRLIDWCNGPAKQGAPGGVTRYLEDVYESRIDLRVAFPDLDTPNDAAAFVAWADKVGRYELPIPQDLLAMGGDHAAARVAEAGDLPLAVNVVGYLSSEVGVGQSARQIIAGLDAHDVPSLSIGVEAPLSRSASHGAAQGHIEAPFDLNIICVNADQLPAFAKEAGPEFFTDRYSIGVWWWELSDFPEQWHGSFAHLDEIWTGSRFIADALSTRSPIPVVSLPLPVAEPRIVPPDRGALGLPEDEFIFLFSFDYNSAFRRKNPDGLIEAFARAFGPDDGVRLVVKSVNHENDPDNHDLLRLAAAPHPHVQLLSQYLPAARNESLMASCDAFVSLHHSEGFGLGLAEALLRRKPVIATDYGGSTDFLTESTGYPVSFRMVDVGAGAPPYPPSSQWAEPDLDHAAALMKHVVANPEEAAARAQRGAQLVRATYTAEPAGARMAQRLSAIHQRRRQTAAQAVGRERAGRLARARRLLRGRGRPDTAASSDVRYAAAITQAENQAELRRLRAELSAVRASLAQIHERDPSVLAAARDRASELERRLAVLET
jgi:glycosyltransferase involved in cell wall biosynthesis